MKKIEKTKVAFIGGLTNGKIVYTYLKNNKYVDLVAVITYPDGINKPRFSKFSDDNKIIKSLDANAHIPRLKEMQLDFIFVAGWSQLLSKELIEIPQRGTIGFHPAKLPFNRGRSVIAWQIEEGYKETALTMFYYNNIPDTGDIIAIENIKIAYNDYINDVLDKMDEATYNLMYAYFPLIRVNKAPRLKQNINIGNFRRLRKEKDSLINWDANSEHIYNKIRAISFPYPGAIGNINGLKYKIWKAQVIDFPYGINLNPGQLVATLYDKSMVIKTRDGFIKINEYDTF